MDMVTLMTTDTLTIMDTATTNRLLSNTASRQTNNRNKLMGATDTLMITGDMDTPTTTGDMGTPMITGDTGTPMEGTATLTGMDITKITQRNTRNGKTRDLSPQKRKKRTGSYGSKPLVLQHS